MSLFTLLLFSYGINAQTLIISEVADPGDTWSARFVELYNATNSTIDLTAGNWYLSRQSNGSSWANVSLTGTIASGATYVIARNDADFTAAYSFTADLIDGAVNVNGDDGLFLYIGGDHTTGTLVDAYGVIDQDGTGEPWEYENSHAVRVQTIGAGNTTWTAGEWTITSADVIDMTPGVHTCDFPGGGTNDQTSYADATGVTQPAGAIIPSTNWNATAPTPTAVFQFNIADAGTADGLPTEVTEITIKAGLNNTADWTEDIGGGYLIKESSGTMLTITTQPNVQANQVTFYIDDTELDITDGGNELLTLYIWPDSTLTDKAVVECMIDADAHGFVADNAGSTFAADFGADITGNQFTFGVSVTKFTFVTQPSDVVQNVVMSPSVELAGTDLNGNVDIDFPETPITLLFSGTGNMGGTNVVNTIAGVATFNDLTFDAIEPGVNLHTAGGGFPEETSNLFDVTEPFIVSKLLITEIAVTPTAGEFIEIYNPGSSAVNLSNYYITDATYASGGSYYYNIVLGANYGGGGFGDFHARFPDGATINAGEVQTIALTGSDNFFTTYSVNCTYELYEDAGTPDGIPDMREAAAGSINGQGGLTNGGEVCILYAWDGSSDLVTDVDYFMWGDTNEGVDKSGVTINSSTYNNDTPLASQEFMTPTHASGSSWQRTDMSEGTQTTTGGNGVNGRDETSENITVTWGENLVTPNTIPAPPSPTISITSPTEGSVEATADVDIVFTVENFAVGDNSGGSDDGHIHYTVDGGSVVMYYSTNPISLTGLSNGPHTVITQLVDNAHQPLIPNVADTVHFTVSVVTGGGVTCGDAVTVGVGTHHAIHPQGGLGDYDQWYVYTAPANGTITVTDCGMTNIDTDVQIIEDNCVGSNFDDIDDNCSSQETLDFTVVAGMNYYIGWGNWGSSGDEHDWELIFTPAPPPINIVNAYSVTNDSIVVFYESGLASVDPADFTLTATGQTTVNFTQATIDAVYDSIVYLKAQNNFTLNAIRDNLNDAGHGTTYQFYAGLLPFNFVNTANHPDTIRQGYNVTLTGIVTADDEYNQVWIQDSNDAMHGVLIADNDLGDNVNVGDSIAVVGQKTFYYGMTEIENPVLLSVNSGFNEMPAIVNPVNLNYNLTQDDPNAEPWEGQLVTVNNIVIDSMDSQNHYEYFGHDCDGNLICFNDDVDYHYGSGFALTNGTMYNVTGVVTFSFGKYKVNPRGTSDAVEVVRDMTSVIEDPDNQVAVQTININNVADSINAIEVFKFKVTDEGTDGLPTALSQMTIYTGPNNTISLDGDGISGGWFDFGNALNPIEFIDEPVITGNQIVFQVNPATAVIDNGTSRDVILHLWFDPANLTDGDILQFETYANPHGFLSGCLNSQFASAFTANVTGGEITIDKPDAISEITENIINLYPNPANNNLFAENMDNISSVSIVNVLGKVVKTISVSSKNAEFNISDLTNGMYFIEFNNTDGTKSVRSFIKK